MKKPERSKLTGEVKIKKTSHVILSPSTVTLSEAKSLRINSAKDLKKAARILKGGGVVIFPTDTVYGIGCCFDNQEAINRIRQIKGTPRNQPFPILVSKISQVKKLAIVTKIGKKLISKYWPGGLTIILYARHLERERRIYSDSSATPQNDISKVGFRMPDSDFIRSFINKVGVPIIGTSANFYGQKPAKSFKDLDSQILELADFVIKGRCQKGIESTIVDATSDPPKVLRKGAITLLLSS